MRALLAALVVLMGLSVVADRVGVRVADHVIADQIATHGGLAAPPEVDVTGVPFLTQAIAGTYHDVHIRLSADQLGQPAGTSAEVSLQGVHVPLAAVLTGSVTTIPVDRIDGRATLSYSLLARQLGGDATVARSGDGLRITKTVQVLGIDVPLAGTGAVRLDDRDLVVSVDRASVVGIELPRFVVRAAQGLLDVRYPVPALPFGLRLTGLQVADPGVDVTVLATDAVLG